MGADDVGLDEGVRVVDGAIHMAFGGEVDNDVELMVGHQPLDQRGVVDVP